MPLPPAPRGSPPHTTSLPPGHRQIRETDEHVQSVRFGLYISAFHLRRQTPDAGVDGVAVAAPGVIKGASAYAAIDRHQQGSTPRSPVISMTGHAISVCHWALSVVWLWSRW